MSGYKVVLYVDEKSLLQNLQKGGFPGTNVPDSLILGTFQWVFIQVQSETALPLWNRTCRWLYLNTKGEEEVYKWGPDAAHADRNRILGEFIFRNQIPCRFIIDYLY